MSFKPACAFGKQITASKSCFGLRAPGSVVNLVSKVLFSTSVPAVPMFSPDIRTFHAHDCILWPVNVPSGGFVSGFSGSMAWKMLICISDVDYSGVTPFDAAHVNPLLDTVHWQEAPGGGDLAGPWFQGDNMAIATVFRPLPQMTAGSSTGGFDGGARDGAGYLSATTTSVRAGFTSDGSDPFVQAGGTANGSFVVEWSGTHFQRPTIIQDDVTPLGTNGYGIYPWWPFLNGRSGFAYAPMLECDLTDGSLHVKFWIDGTRTVEQTVEWDDFYDIDGTFADAQHMLTLVSFDDFPWNKGMVLTYSAAGVLQKNLVSLLRTEALPNPPFPAGSGVNVPILNKHVNAFGSWQPFFAGWTLSRAQVNICGKYADQLYQKHLPSGPTSTACTLKTSNGLEKILLDVPGFDPTYTFAVRGIIPSLLAPSGGDLMGFCEVTPPF
jgi:hypothetical protein